MTEKNKRQNKINVWYFYTAGIGSFLLALNTVESVYFSIPESERGNCYLVSGGNIALAQKMSAAYPHVQVIQFNRKHLASVFATLRKSLFDKNYIIYAASFGEPSILNKVAGFVMKIARPSETILVGFCRPSIINKLLLTHLFMRDPNVSLFKSTVDAISTVVSAKYRSPQLLFSYDSSLNLRPATIIFHPFPANERRALPPDRNRDLIEHIVKNYPLKNLIISGGPENKPAYEELIAGLGNPPPFICDLADFSSQLQIISESLLFIGVDTGATHIASVLGCSVIVLGNRSNPCWLPTYSSNTDILTSLEGCTCEGEKKGDCGIVSSGVKRYACLVNIKQDDIYKSIRNALSDV